MVFGYGVPAPILLTHCTLTIKFTNVTIDIGIKNSSEDAKKSSTFSRDVKINLRDGKINF